MAVASAIDLVNSRDVPDAPRGRLADAIVNGLCKSASAVVLAISVGLVVVFVAEALPFWTMAGFQPLRTVAWNPGGAPPTYGALALIYGTLATSVIAMSLAMPLGIAAAVFLTEMAPNCVRQAGTVLVELLAVIPGVVYGLWGLNFITPLVGGPGLLAAGLILAVMIVPTIVAGGCRACRAVPDSQRDAAIALGATRWQSIWWTVLPAARPGLIAACFLALGRALGETMAVTMIIGNSAIRIEGPFGGIGDSITSAIANQLNEAGSTIQRSGLMAIGLVLLMATAAINLAARRLIRRARRIAPGGLGRGQSVVVIQPSDPGQTPRGLRIPPNLANAVMTVVFTVALLIVVLPLFMIVATIVVRGSAGLSWGFFTKLPNSPNELSGGLAHAIVGSLRMVMLAVIGATAGGVPVGLMLAEDRGGRFASLVRGAVEFLTGVPSILVGAFTYSVLVVAVNPPRFSGWAGGCALGVIAAPLIAQSTEQAMRAVPRSLRFASLALGATLWQTTFRVSLPYSWPAIVAGVLRATARIAGETAPLLLTAYGSSFFARTFADNTPFLTKYIFDYATSGFPVQQEQAWAAALVLLGFVGFLDLGVRSLANRRNDRAMRFDAGPSLHSLKQSVG